MMRWIIATSARARGVMALTAAALIGLGAWQVSATHVDSLPEFLPPTVQIQTEALGLSAAEVEQLITVPLEQDLLAGVPWLDTMRSESIPGLSSVELIFDRGTDLLRARQAVQERLTQAAGLPNVSGPPQMLQPLSSTSRIMMIRLSSATVTPIQMSVLARWTIRPKLLGVPGVANVSIWGQRERQLQVRVDPDRLRQHGLTLDEVIETSGNALWASPLTFLEASTPGSGGFIDTAQQRLGIQHLQPITTAGDLAEVPIHADGRTLRLGDVADVVEDHQPLIGDAVFTDGNPGLLLVVEKFPGSNTAEVTRGVDMAVEALRPGLSGIDVDTSVYRPADYIERSAGNLGRAFLVSLLLIVLALGLLMFGWRSALIAIVAGAAALSAAWLVLSLTGTPVNTMTMVGLVTALVVIVDDAVIDVDNAGRRIRQQRLNGAEPTVQTSLIAALLEMRTAIVYATLMILLALVPLLFVRAEAAPFVPSILVPFSLAIGASMLVALTITPALGLLLLPGAEVERRGSPLIAWLVRGYDRALAAAARFPRRTYAGAGLVVLAGLMTLPALAGASLPSFRDGSVLIDLRATPGTSLPEMDRITQRIGTELTTLRGVREVGAHIGRAITSDQVAGVDTAQLWVSLDPDADYDATLASMQGVVDGYTGISHDVRTYSDERIEDVLAEDHSPIVVRVYGQDLDVLHEEAEQVLAAMSKIDGVVAPRMELQPVEPVVDVRVDLERAERYGVVPGDVRRAAATLMSGIGVGSLFEEQKVFDVVVWGEPEVRNGVGSVRHLPIDTTSGGQVRLGQVADVTIAAAPTVIRHRDLSRNLDIVADVQDRDVDAVTADVRHAIETMSFPLEYHAELVGDQADRAAATRRAIAIAVAVALGIVLLLQAAFGSWRLAAAALLVLPVAMSGCLLASAIGDRVLSLGSAIGFLAVLAIAIRVGVTLIRHYQRLEKEASTPRDPGLIRRGSRERFAPIVTTAVTVAVALLPFAMSGGSAGQEVLQPMAIVVEGGLVTSALAALFVVPILYLRFAPVHILEPGRSDLIVIPEIDQVPER
ncbi:MAG TPA: efflux RND transporter permease subunit [Actinomycetota bacterium]|nr:efflux RND transporter permease subunit [Actinomycetota bacterium]